MKKVIIFTFFSLFILGSSLTSCKEKSATSENTEVKSDGPEYTSMYVCPMHCAGSGSGEPGKCPACGMDYEQNPNAKPHDGSHKHEHGDGHDHGHEH